MRIVFCLFTILACLDATNGPRKKAKPVKRVNYLRRAVIGSALIAGVAYGLSRGDIRPALDYRFNQLVYEDWPFLVDHAHMLAGHAHEWIPTPGWVDEYFVQCSSAEECTALSKKWVSENQVSRAIKALEQAGRFGADSVETAAALAIQHAKVADLPGASNDVGQLILKASLEKWSCQMCTERLGKFPRRFARLVRGFKGSPDEIHWSRLAQSVFLSWAAWLGGSPAPISGGAQSSKYTTFFGLSVRMFSMIL